MKTLIKLSLLLPVVLASHARAMSDVVDHREGGAEVQLALTNDLMSPPLVTVDAPSGFLGCVRRPTIEGKTQTNVTVVIFLDGVELDRTTSDRHGNYGLVPSVDLPEGTHSLQAAVEVRGVLSTKSTPSIYIIDCSGDPAKPPVAPSVVSPTDGLATNDATPTIHGVANPGVKVTVFIDGTAVGTTSSDEQNGAWSLTPPGGLAEGQHTVSAQAANAHGNGPQSAPRSFIVDTRSPDTSITEGPSGEIQSGDATFTFAATEPNVQYECSLNGADYRACTAPATWTELGAGAYELRVRARDQAGNVDDTPATRKWSIGSGGGAPGSGTYRLEGSGVGCSAAGAGSPAMALAFLMVALGMARRR